jgi:hypothetical protein
MKAPEIMTEIRYEHDEYESTRDNDRNLIRSMTNMKAPEIMTEIPIRSMTNMKAPEIMTEIPIGA